MENTKSNLILDKTFDFALQIIELYKKLLLQHEYVLSKQILRSGTSIGANAEEAVGGHSKKDFIARMIIAHKECRETRYWLRLLHKSKLIEFDFDFYLKMVDDIFNILTAIINTSRKNLGIALKIYFFVFSLSLSYYQNLTVV